MPASVHPAHLSGHELQALIAAGQRRQVLFAAVGLVCTMVAVLTLVAAFVDLLVDGLPRLSLEFLSNSRRGARRRRGSCPRGWAARW